MVGKVVIVAGPPGAGKTTVCRALIAQSDVVPGPTIYIEADTFWKHFVGSSSGPGEGKGHAILLASVAAALSYAMCGHDVILDFSVPPISLERIKVMAEKRNVPIAYVAILPDKQVCAKRMASRSEGASKDYSRYDDLYNEFSSTPSANLLRTDANMPVEEIVARIRAGIAANTFVVR